MADPKLRSVLTMEMAPFVSGAAKASAIGRGLARQFAASPVKFAVTAGIVGGERAVRGIVSGVGAAAGMAASGMKWLTVSTLAAGAALAAGTVGTMKMGSELEIMHRRTGMAVGRLAQMKRWLGDNNLELDAVVPAIRKMSAEIEKAHMGDAGAQGRFYAAGLDPEQLRQMAPEDAFLKSVSAVSKMREEFSKMNTAKNLFGREGLGIVGAGADKEGLAKAMGPLSEKAKLLEQNAETFHRVTVLLSHAGEGLKSFFVGFASGIGGNLEAILEKFKASDLSGVGLKFADSMKDAAAWVMTAWQDPKATFEFFFLQAKLSLMEFANWGYDAITKMFPNAKPIIDGWIGSAREFTAELGAGIEKAFQSARSFFIEAQPFIAAAFGLGRAAIDTVGMVAKPVAIGLAKASVALSGGENATAEERERWGKAEAGTRKTGSQIDAEWRKRAGLMGNGIPLATITGAAPFDTTDAAGNAAAARARVGAKKDANKAALPGAFEAESLRIAADFDKLAKASTTAHIAQWRGIHAAPPTSTHIPGSWRMMHGSLQGAGPLVSPTMATGLGIRGMMIGAGRSLSTFGQGDGATGNILSHATRIAIRNSAIGGPGESERLAAGGFSTTAIHSGDAQRRREFTRKDAEEKTRAAAGKRTSDEALNSIAKTSAQIASATMATATTLGAKVAKEGNE